MKKDIIPASIRIILTPSLILLALIFLVVAMVKIGLPQIGKQSQALSNAEKNERILAQKEATLRDISGTVLSQAESASVALPEKNPALITLSQLRLLAGNSGVILKNIKVGTGAEEASLFNVGISFDAEGPLSSVLDFLGSVKNISPITSVQRVKMTQIGSLLNAETSLKGYWSPFPKSLPALTEPITSLTSSDKDTLDKILALTPPTFSEVAPGEPTLRENPF